MTEGRDAETRREPIPVSRVRRRCDPEELGFETTAELEPLPGMLGQDRAEEAMRFGVGVRHQGFNLYVLGPAGVGKHRLVDDVVSGRAERAPVPDDWVYVHRFDDADRPQAIRLPVGRGAELQQAMDRVVEELGDAIRAAFETDEFRNRRRVIEQKIEGRHEEAFTALAEKAEESGLKLLRTPMGFAFAPFKDGEVLEPKKFNELPEEEQKQYRERLEEMEESLRVIMQQVPKWQREAREELKALEREMAGYAAAQQMRDVKEAFADLEDVAEWLGQVEEDAVDNAAVFVAPDEDDPEAMMHKALSRSTGGALTRYRVNLFIDRRKCEGAPIIHEDHPTLDRLVGRIEQRAQLGALVSDFTLIKPGAMHRANGGYLVLDAMRLLTSPSAWDSLKRALRRREIEIESLGKSLGLSTGTLEPDPIPLDVKIVLVGERRLYYLLSALDPDFDQLFKVAADFEDDVEWDGAPLTEFARLVSHVVQDEELLPADKHAVARLVEHAARLADDQKKLSTNLTKLCDVLREGDWLARERGAERIERRDVQGAIEARRRRGGRLRERILERFHDKTILIATAGECVGQINGLSVLQVGSTRFGQPNRISCRIRIGKGEVVDIEREVQLGGPLHSKGVLILSSFLGAKYALERPLSLSASLVFEQSYGGVDGDSASCAELCALLSALADVPIQQRFAITGSVDQMGRVQAIGGVNEKIEGFFDVCAHEGLDGSHGVIVPATNVQHLMLREDVVKAIEEEKFRVYEVGHVDEALELLTGIAAGAADEDGVYPEDTIHGKAARRLARFAEKAKEFALAVRAGQETKKAEDVGPAPPQDDDGGPRD